MSGKDTPSPASTASPRADLDLPALYTQADSAAGAAQRLFFTFQKYHITCLVLGSAAAATSAVVDSTIGRWLHVLSTLALGIGVLLTWIAYLRKDELAWFQCRVIAESVKTASWQFVTKSPPFANDQSLVEAFIACLRTIRHSNPAVLDRLTPSISDSDQMISDSMMRLRQAPWEQRRQVYREQRLQNQRVWYARKATRNATLQERWLIGAIFLQIAAIGCGVAIAITPTITLNLIPFLTTAAASAVAWTRMRRYSELAYTYSITAQELLDLEALEAEIDREEGLAGLVRQIENAISREHTLWHARSAGRARQPEADLKSTDELA